MRVSVRPCERPARDRTEIREHYNINQTDGKITAACVRRFDIWQNLPTHDPASTNMSTGKKLAWGRSPGSHLHAAHLWRSMPDRVHEPTAAPNFTTAKPAKTNSPPQPGELRPVRHLSAANPQPSAAPPPSVQSIRVTILSRNDNTKERAAEARRSKDPAKAPNLAARRHFRTFDRGSGQAAPKEPRLTPAARCRCRT